MSIFRKFMTLKVKTLTDIMNIARINERMNLYINLPLFLLVSMWFQSFC